jgi:hypothetical protein
VILIPAEIIGKLNDDTKGELCSEHSLFFLVEFVGVNSEAAKKVHRSRSSNRSDSRSATARSVSFFGLLNERFQ